MFGLWKVPHYGIFTMSEILWKVTFSDFLRNKKVRFRNRVKILVGAP